MNYHFGDFEDGQGPRSRIIEAIRRLVLDHGMSWLAATRTVMPAEKDALFLELVADYLERRERKRE